MIATFRVAGAALSFVVFASASAHAADASGVWVANEGQSRIKVEPCGPNLCGTIVWLSEPQDPQTGKPKLDKNNPESSLRSRPIIGLRILNMSPEREGQWRGQIYNGQDGETYNVTVRAEGAALQVQGCVLAGIICKTQTWTRYGG